MRDLISREAALKLILSGRVGDDSHFECPEECNSMLEWAADGVSKMPAADVPDRKVGKWIPVKTRPMDEEERVEWSEKLGYDIEYDEAVIYTSQLPDDGQEVLICSRYGTVRIDRFENDPDYGCSFEENGDMDGIVAWMPLPEPWKGEEDAGKE